MMLLIDAGNTRAKFAWASTDAPGRKSPVEVLDYAELNRLASRLPQAPRRILASNVAGAQIRAALEDACKAAWGLGVRWCGTRDGQALLQNRYSDPSQLGADRWLGLLGVLQHVRDDPAWKDGSPCLLASFGTATTVDALMPRHLDDGTDGAAFIGGLILPGASLMARSLVEGTAQLPLAQDGQPADFPLDTHAAIRSGIAAAQGGALLHQWRLATQAAAGRPPLVFTSGGGWPRISAAITAALTRAQADLGQPLRAPCWLDSPVLDGLAWLASLPGAGQT